MRVRTAITGICSLLILCTAHVQTRDEFNGGFASNLQWSWRVPLNNPECTLDPTAVTFTSDALQIQMRDGGMFSYFNAHRDVPNLRVVGPVPSNWYIATAFRTDWSVFADYNYVQAGLVVFTDAANYFQLLVTRDANTPGSGNQNVYGSTNIETHDNFAWGERVTNAWIPDSQWIGVKVAHDPSDNTIKLYYRRSTDHEAGGRYEWAGLDTSPWDAASGNSVRLLIRYDPATNRVHFLYDREDGGFWRPLIGSPRALSEFPSLQAVVQQGGSIGLYIDTGGGWAIPPPVAQFDYLEIFSAPLLADINMDGIVDDADLLLVLFDFGATGACMAADLNRDGIVDDADLLQVLFHFGSGC
jgi:hypothetical protein